jgi:hypothetical protein
MGVTAASKCILGKNLWAIQKGTGTKRPMMMDMGMTAGRENGQRSVPPFPASLDPLQQGRTVKWMVKWMIESADKATY